MSSMPWSLSNNVLLSSEVRRVLAACSKKQYELDKVRANLARQKNELENQKLEVEAKQNKLKLDYAEQQRALVGPVQTRVSQRAQAFAVAQGCGELKMARAPDLATLTSAGSRNVTGEFVIWYLANPTS